MFAPPPDAEVLPIVDACIAFRGDIVGICDAKTAVRCKLSLRNFCPAAVDMRLRKRDTVSRFTTETCFWSSEARKAFPVRIGSWTWSEWKARYSCLVPTSSWLPSPSPFCPYLLKCVHSSRQATSPLTSTGSLQKSRNTMII